MASETPLRRARGRRDPLVRLTPDDRRYPASLREGSSLDILPTLTALGNLAILEQQTLAIFCSNQCPGKLILETYDLAQALRDAGVTVVGGFHTPMEQECLRLLLRGRQGTVVCPARSIERLRVPEEWRGAIASERLLVLSTFESGVRRASVDVARQRNRFVALLADEVFVAYAAPGSRTEAFAREVAASAKPLVTLEGPENAALVALGARPIRPSSFRERAASDHHISPGPPGAIPLPLFEAESPAT